MSTRSQASSKFDGICVGTSTSFKLSAAGRSWTWEQKVDGHMHEWLMGCMRLKGMAKCLDVIRVFESVNGLRNQLSDLHAVVGSLMEFPARGKQETG